MRVLSAFVRHVPKATLAKQLMQSVEFHSHPIRLLGLGVSNQKIATAQEQQPWAELELEFEP